MFVAGYIKLWQRIPVLFMNNLVTANIRQRPLRSLISVAGVALGVALVMLFTGLARGMSNDLQRRSSNLRAEIIFTRPGALELTSSSASLSTRYVERLQTIEGVEAAVPVILYFFQGNRGFGFEQIEGVEWTSFANMNGIQLVSGHAPQAADEVVIDVTKARNGKLTTGSQIMLFGNKPYRVSGIYSPESGARVKMSFPAMQDLLEAPGRCTYILVKCKEGLDAGVVAQRINAELPGNKIQFTRDVFTSVEKSVPFLGLFLRVLVGLAAVVSALVVMLAMYTTITERTREIGILKAMGASRGYIIGVIEKEAILISTMGLVAGFIIAIVGGFLIHRVYGLVFEFGWKWGLAAAAIGLLGGVLGALYPAVRAANLDAVSALAYE
ncbi:MAG: putative transport system permease protein [Blastocatellia bacterium]|jgi:putative ABC transport system permease protein|nr:putative transport system permease protein [Blastocatellia bacterium]